MTLTESIIDDLVRLRREIVDPCLRDLFHPGEISSVEFVNSIEENESRLDLRLNVSGEEADMLIWYPSANESVEETKSRLYSELQDFIAESTFGWGQLRGHID